jgi:hypothetical protein
MLGTDVKRGVASTLERVFNSNGERFDKLEVLWTGRTAGIIFNRTLFKCDAKVLFPAIDETAQIPNDTFNNLIGYALHELGHAWFTDNKPWDDARNRHGHFVSNLINGLEDPRIERKVIESGRAPNSRALFENLLNSVLKRDGYVEADDKRNIPFLLAVEGRRLNGYQVNVPNIINDSPWAKHLHWALKRASQAKDTATIVKIAIELFKRIKEQEQAGKSEGNEKSDEGQPQQGDGQDGQPQGDKPSDKPNDGQPSDKQDGDKPKQDGENGQPDGEGDGQPDGDGEQGDGSNGSDSGDGQDGQDGQPSESDGESEGDSQDGEGGGNGKSDTSFDGGRDVEPSDFIQGELSKHSSSADNVTSRPSVGKPRVETFNWR